MSDRRDFLKKAAALPFVGRLFDYEDTEPIPVLEVVGDEHESKIVVCDGWKGQIGMIECYFYGVNSYGSDNTLALDAWQEIKVRAQSYSGYEALSAAMKERRPVEWSFNRRGLVFSGQSEITALSLNPVTGILEIELTSHDPFYMS